MNEKTLSELAVFVPGINPTRAKKQFGDEVVNYYDHQAFETDYKHVEIYVDNEVESVSTESSSLKEGDIVISSSLQLATMVGKNNVGKVLTLNFTKVELDSNKLDKKYFLFMFNTYKEVKRQKEKELQGTGLVFRIPLRALGEITIPVIPIEEQKRIGKVYIETMKLQSKIKKYSDLIEQFTNSIIEDMLKEAIK